ncbi:hypothetical protein A3753_26945 [Sulfitobacter sp. HI0082]|nr:hypothetical protein A3753_12845 [Sulfitobacter sp. HI0082]KZZ29527.1 hypothetical protein A3753_26945 [Sulfitobacter sp. HI0082]
MTKEFNWNWWVGHDDERYHTECVTREEAVRVATEEYDGGYIVEAMKPANIKISRYFDVHSFTEAAEQSAFDDHGDPEGDIPIFDITAEHARDLQDMVRATLDAWQEKHGLTFTGFMFQASRNHEYIPAPDAASSHTEKETP